MLELLLSKFPQHALESQTKQVSALQPWNLSLSERLHIATITELPKPFMRAAEALKRECQLGAGIPQWEERAQTGTWPAARVG